MTKVVLPWPPKELSPNARVHWAPKAKKTARYKLDCSIAMFGIRKTLKGKNKFQVTFRPPDKRHRDMDGLISRFKAGQDAIEWATGVNDRHFVMTYAFGEPFKGGAVIVEVVA